jgi:hypothetical protein
MAYWIRYKDTAGGAYTTITLSPGPTEVEYPERRAMETKATQDGATVIQRPLRDTRPRKWVWKGYIPTLVPYTNQWNTLLSLEYSTRLEAGKYALVEIWEDVVAEGGFNRLDASQNKIWTSVKFLRVDRTAKKGGGSISYDDSFIEFVIEDTGFVGY